MKLLDALGKYQEAVEAERVEFEKLDKLRVGRDAAERVARDAAIACDEARNRLWAEVEALAGSRAQLWKILEIGGVKPNK